MKKGLSVLLIAAALFGFYGGAVSLNDVLACKDYWEKEDERTTSDLNKLEDGLNQLMDNEEAYLDGLDQVEQGEKDIAEGEKTLEEGRATLAQGEADYAAAPGKLAAGEQQLAEGKQSLSALDKLIKGLKKAKKGYDDQWQPGFEHKASKSALAKMAEGKKTSDSPGLAQARKVITSNLNTPENKKNIALIENLAGAKGLISGVSSDKSYKQYDEGIQNLSKAFGKAQKALKELSDLAKKYGNEDKSEEMAGLRNATEVELAPNYKKKISELDLATTKKVLEGAKQKKADAEKTKSDLEGALAQFEQIPEEERDTKEVINPVTKTKTSATVAIATVKGAIKQYEAGIATASESVKNLNKLVTGRENAKALLNGILEKAGSKLSLAANLSPALANMPKHIQDLAGVGGTDLTNGDYAATYEALQAELKGLAKALDEKIADIKTNKKTFDSWDDGYKQLKAGQDELSDTKSGVPFAFKMMISNATIRKALNKNAKSVIPVLAKYSSNKLGSSGEDLDDFDKDMNKVSKAIRKVLPVLYGIKADGQKQVAAGKAELAKGYADYAAAPGKLAEGRAALAEGEKALKEGRQTLADGKAKLAEYEDGEQQVRDGLATLMASEANGGLDSILDRQGGDADFDNGDLHLELPEGLDAVDSGRSYKADSGELITKEISNRAIGAGVGLGAGALAVLAALLSFLKKHKAAGAAAILSAVAGGASLAIGQSAGMEFSNIAGSLVGATPKIAFALLAGVAVIHAIVHFAAKKSA